jgi:transcriptional regulator with XRE-family HTH domain
MTLSPEGGYAMKEVGERLKQLRESASLSQMKLGGLNGYNQSNLARYENGKAVPPLKLLLWYADYFDVSMDYIFARTDSPQGKLYAYNPKITADSEQLRQFIEMCFDPDSLVSGKLKSTLLEMFLKEGIGK